MITGTACLSARKTLKILIGVCGVALLVLGQANAGLREPLGVRLKTSRLSGELRQGRLGSRLDIGPRGTEAGRRETPFLRVRPLVTPFRPRARQGEGRATKTRRVVSAQP